MTGSELKATGKKLTLGGKEYEIVLDMNALCEMEEKYGSIDKAFASLGKMVDGAGKGKVAGGMKDIRFLLYVMMKHSDPNITETEAGQLMTIDQMQNIMDSLGSAMSNSLPEASEKNAESPQET